MDASHVLLILWVLIWFMVTSITQISIRKSSVLTVSINCLFFIVHVSKLGSLYNTAAWDKTEDHGDKFKIRLSSPEERQHERNQTSPQFSCWHVYNYTSILMSQLLTFLWISQILLHQPSENSHEINVFVSKVFGIFSLLYKNQRKPSEVCLFISEHTEHALFIILQLYLVLMSGFHTVSHVCL